MFEIRAALAATLRPTWGVYSGFELYEHVAVKPGSEEYLDSEKYELRPRDFDKALADGRVPAAVADPAQRDPPRAPGAAADAHAALPPHRPRRTAGASPSSDPATGDAVLVVVNARPARVPRGHDVRSTCRRSASTGTSA